MSALVIEHVLEFLLEAMDDITVITLYGAYTNNYEQHKTASVVASVPEAEAPTSKFPLDSFRLALSKAEESGFILLEAEIAISAFNNINPLSSASISARRKKSMDYFNLIKK